MINLTDLDLRYADHGTKVERVNRAGWKRAETAAPVASQSRGVRHIVGVMRRHGGEALVRVGERLHGAPADYRVKPKAAA